MSALVKHAFVAAVLLALGCDASAKPEPDAQEQAEPPAANATWIEAAVMQRTDATLELTVPGEVEGSREATLAAAQGGLVELADVEVGDAVKTGQVLFRIDTALYRARLDQVKAELRAAKREHDRAQKLGKVISGAERDQAKDRYDAARAAAKVAEVQASRAVIRAPFDGVMATVDLEKGEVAGPGTPAGALVTLDPIKVTVSVPDRDVVGLEVGAKVRVQTDALPTPRTGTLSRIAPSADIDTRTFLVDIEVPNEDGALMPGMIARVHIAQPIAEDRLVIPQSFLVTQREANGVFVVEEDVARWRPLELGALIRDQVVIEGGLRTEDNVVVVGQRALADGDQVIISRQGRCCTGGRAEFDQ